MARYFTINEMLKSDVAAKNGINNFKATTPDIIVNCEYTLQRLDKIREIYGKPIIISSGYRCKQLNDLVGGAPNSQHLSGFAVDIQYDLNLIEAIKKYGHFDQLILEQKKRSKTKWLHISFKPNIELERKQILNLNV